MNIKNLLLNLVIITLLVSLLIAGIMVGVMFDDDIIDFIYGDIRGKPVQSDCQNLSLFETAECLNNHVRTIYKYHETDDEVDLTIEELYEKGGDCKDWAEYYDILIGCTGYEGKTHQVPIEEGYAHRFATISGPEGYCVLDQNKLLGCFYFGSYNDEI